MTAPDVAYARSGDVAIAYQVIGSGPVDIVFMRAITGDLLSTWDQPLLVRHVEGLATSGRVLMLDKRGTGLSDRVREVQSLETSMDDIRAVMDAAGSERAVLWSGGNATGIGLLFAATYPERCAGLVLFDPRVMGTRSPEYPWAMTAEEWANELRDIRTRIRGSEVVELPPLLGLYTWVDDEAHRATIDASAGFVSRLRAGRQAERVLATVLFTDIVGSTELAGHLGDTAWRELLERHHAIVRRELARFQGKELDTAGDGFFASFDGPARAVQAAAALRDPLRAIGVEIRAGLHTGEFEVSDGKIVGIAVSIGARISSLAGPGEVLVSSTVKDLVAGSGLRFEDRGEHQLKGIPDGWRLFAVAG